MRKPTSVLAIILAGIMTLTACGNTPVNTTYTEVETTVGYVGDDATKISSSNAAFDFGTERIYGSIWMTNMTVGYEALCGAIVKTNGSKVTFTPYTHSAELTPETAALYNYDAYYDKKSSLKNITSSIKKTKDDKVHGRLYTASTVDMSDYTDGFYDIIITWSKNEKLATTTALTIRIRAGKAYTCCIAYAHATDVTASMKNIRDVMADADPDDYTSLKDLTYPTSGWDGRCVQVNEWTELANDIIKKDTWSDEFKVYMITQKLATEYAYDRYKTSSLNSTSRAKEHDYKDKNDFTYYNHVGVCWDFTNIVTIMCRSQGIPCTSVENGGHTYAVVYLNDRWCPVDITVLQTYTCPTASTDKSNWTKRGHDLSGYLNIGSFVDTHDYQIWTFERAAVPIAE